MRNIHPAEEMNRLNGEIKGRLKGFIQDFYLQAVEQGLVLRGRSRTYYGKQLAQTIVMEVTKVPILANEIEVL